MNATPANDSILLGQNLRKSFRRDTGETVMALDDISIAVDRGTLAAIVGPDGAGKTTLIRLIAGLMPLDGGKLTVLGFDVARDPQQVQDRIAYMPQRFGLYDDLSVQENLDLYADLHGLSITDRMTRYPELLEMTALAPFTTRLAGKLSGGMKQKLGLACTLVGSPALLLLDEPTVGVDPLSRRELWEIIVRLVRDRSLTVLTSTSYLDEADHCDHAFVLREGKLLASSPPQDVANGAAGCTFEVQPTEGELARSSAIASAGQPGNYRCGSEGRSRTSGTGRSRQRR